MSSRVKKTALSTTMLASFMAGTAVAQDGDVQREAEETVIELIVVTAQKRQELLIDVPQAVSVLSKDDLEKSAVTQLRDLAGSVPGLTLTSLGAGQNQITLRGVTAGTVGVAATVSTYIDDIPYGSSTAFGRNSRFLADGALFNVSQIEILRGPQGTLYGASSMGGLLKYVTVLPDPSDFFGNVSAGVSTTKEGGLSYLGSLAVNLPVTENSALRLSGFYTRDGGFVDNVDSGEEDVDRAELSGVRADFLTDLTDRLSIRLVAEVQQIERDGASSVDFTPEPNSVPLVGALSQSRPISEAFDQDFLLLAGTITYDFDHFSLTSISSYQEIESETTYDASPQFVGLLNSFLGPIYGGFGISDTPDTEKFTQEIRFVSSGDNLIDWVLGGYYTNEDGKRLSEAIVEDMSGAPLPNFVDAFGLPLAILDAPSDYEEKAVFGNITINFTDRFDVTGGVRYSKIDQTYDQTISGILFEPFTGFFPASSSENVTTYLANARYSFSDYSTAYFRFATGYRPGGPNFVVLPTTPPVFEADTLNSYELGYRITSVDGAYSLDAAVFYIGWSDIQVFDTTNPLGGFANATGGAEIYGVEVSVTARPIEGLSLDGNFAYQNASLNEAEPNLLAAAGDPLPNVPEISFAFNADYEFPLGSLMPIIGGSVRYVSERESTYSLSPQRHTLPSYTVVDLRAGIAIGQVDAQLYVHNVGDVRGEISAVSASGIPAVSIIRPRTVGLRAMVDF